MRAWWLTAGAVVTVFALALSTAGLWDAFATARTPTDATMRSIPFEGGQLRIVAGKGRVSLDVLAGRAGELILRRELRWSADRPTVTEDWNAGTGTLRLDAVCPGFDQPGGPVCQAHYIVLVPPETGLEASTSSGRLTAGGIFADVRLTSVSGNVRVRSVSGDVWARTGTGDVTGDELSGSRADVEVGTGDVELRFTGAPSSVKATVRTTGDIGVTLPRDVYDVTADGANTTIDIMRSPDSPRKIVLSALDGMVSVCCR